MIGKYLKLFVFLHYINRFHFLLLHIFTTKPCSSLGGLNNIVTSWLCVVQIFVPSCCCASLFIIGACISPFLSHFARLKFFVMINLLFSFFCVFFFLVLVCFCFLFIACFWCFLIKKIHIWFISYVGLCRFFCKIVIVYK